MNEIKCCYCGGSDPHTLLQCNVCKKWFCNCSSNGQGSHIYMHLSIAHHYSVKAHKKSVYKGINFQCSECHSSNLFDLRYNPEKITNGIPTFLCYSKCLSKKNLNNKHFDIEKWKPVTDQGRIVKELMGSPSPGPTLPKNFCRQLVYQYEITSIYYPSIRIDQVKLDPEQKLRRIQLDYEDTLDYYYVFEPLIRVEENEQKLRELMDGDKHMYVKFNLSRYGTKVLASFNIHMCEYSRELRQWDSLRLRISLIQDDYEGISDESFKNHAQNVEGRRLRNFRTDDNDAAADIAEEGDELDTEMGAGLYANITQEQRVEYVGNIFSLTLLDRATDLYACVLELESAVIPPGSHRYQPGFFDIHLKDAASVTERRINAISKMDEESSMHQTIFDILLGNRQAMNRYSFYVPKEERTISYNAPGLRPLNESQQQALVHCLRSRFTLIQGPPGTGKTNTAATIVYQLVKRTREGIPDYPLKYKRYYNDKETWSNFKPAGRVLVCTPSNVAADEICKRIHMTGVNVVRLMAISREGLASPVQQLCVHTMAMKNLNEEAKDVLKRHNEGETLDRQEWKQYLRDIGNEKKRILQEAEVVVCTCDTSGSVVMNGQLFNTVLIDEASQTTEPETLVPIVHGAQRVILVGDQCQLQPVVISLQCKACGYNVSLFERLIKLGLKTQLLTTQYRMHPILPEFSNMCFYEGQLENGITTANRPILRTFPYPNKKRPIVFWNVVGKETVGTKGTSYQNVQEGMACIDVIKSLLRCQCTPSQIGVITSYTGQRLLLNNLLSQSHLDIECASINTFQGREKDYIIFSCVRSNPDKQIGFLRDRKRLNVALTRARFGIIVIGDASMLKNDELWDQYVKYNMKNKTLVSGDISSWKVEKSL